MTSFSQKAISAIQPTEKIQSFNAGPGLLLLVTPRGRKTWVARLTKDGKETRKTLGDALKMPVKEARRLCDAARAAYKGATAPTLGHVIEEYLAYRADNVTAETAQRNRQLLTGYNERLLTTPIADVSRKSLVDGLLVIARKKSPTIASRTASLTGAVFRFAVGRGLLEVSPAERLGETLPKPAATVHRAAIIDDTKALGDILRGIDGIQNPGPRRIIQLITYCFPRVSEVLLARWRDIDGDIWTIPAEHQKRRKTVRLVLPRQAQAVLSLQRDEVPGGPDALIFPSMGIGDEPYTRAAITFHMVRYSLGGRQTLHGWRAVASSHLAQMGYPSDWVEAALGHSPEAADAVRAAYQRYDYIEERRGMMQAYADWLDSLKKE